MELVVFLLIVLFLLIVSTLFGTQKSVFPVSGTGFLPTALEYGLNPTEFLRTWKKKLGDSFRVNLFFFNPVFVLDPTVAVKLMSASLKDLSTEVFLERFVAPIVCEPGNKLFMEKEVTWMGVAHQCLREGFTAKKSLEKIMIITDQEKRKWLRKNSNGQPFDALAEFSRLILRIALLHSMGMDVLEIKDESWLDELAVNLKEMELNGLSPICMMMPWFPFGPAKRVRVARHKIKAALQEILLKRMQQKDRSNDCYMDTMLMYLEKANNNRGPDSKDTPIDYLLVNLLILIMAFHINLAGTLMWTFLHLGADAKLARETRGRLIASLSSGEEGAEFGGKTIEHLVFETLRIYGGNMNIPRKAERDLEINGFHFPKGTEISFHQPAMVYNLLSKPEQYDPWRWEGPEGEKIRAQKQFAPFGGGVHACVGKQLAMNIMKDLFTEIITNYEIELGDSFPQIDYSKNVGLSLPLKAVLKMKPIA